MDANVSQVNYMGCENVNVLSTVSIVIACEKLTQ
jgi:hypothetical protein